MGCLDGDGVHYGVDGHSGELLLLLKGDSELIEGAYQLGVDLVEALGTLLPDGSGVVADGLEVDIGHLEVTPFGRGEGEPVTVGLEAEVEHPVGLAFLARDEADDVLVEAYGDDVGVDIGDEAVFIVAAGDVVENAARGGIGMTVFAFVHNGS